MSSTDLSATSSGPGFGNKTDDSSLDLSEHHSNTRYDIQHTEAYSGGHADYRSGTVAGPGSGNKIDAASDGPDLSEQHSNTRLEKTGTEPYQDGTEFGSGTVGGPGFGNKTAGPKTDSTSGKLMEKVGSLTKNEGMVQKGAAKREEAAAAASA